MYGSCEERLCTGQNYNQENFSKIIPLDNNFESLPIFEPSTQRCVFFFLRPRCVFSFSCMLSRCQPAAGLEHTHAAQPTDSKCALQPQEPAELQVLALYCEGPQIFSRPFHLGFLLFPEQIAHVSSQIGRLAVGPSQAEKQPSLQKRMQHRHQLTA